MTRLDSQTESKIDQFTENELNGFVNALNPEQSSPRNLAGFQINHHDGYAGTLFSVTILTEQTCFSLLLRADSEIQVFHADLKDKGDLRDFLFAKIHDKENSLYGFPLLNGPTMLNALVGVKVASIRQIRDEYFNEIRLNFASLMTKDAFKDVAVGILPRLQEITEILATDLEKRTK